MTSAWKVGDRLVHTNFGEGVVSHVYGNPPRVSIAVAFAAGPKVLDPALAPLTRLAAEPEPEPEPDLELPEKVARSRWRWRGAEFSHPTEMLLAKALMDQGAAGVASNSSMLLQRSSKLHRKPDLLVFHLVDDRLIHGIAEVDGGSHEGRWVEDQARDRELQAAGFLAVRHYTAEEVFADPVKTAKDFLAFLERFHPTGQRASLLKL
jgi:hypothetical protein